MLHKVLLVNELVPPPPQTLASMMSGVASRFSIFSKFSEKRGQLCDQITAAFRLLNNLNICRGYDACLAPEIRNYLWLYTSLGCTALMGGLGFQGGQPGIVPQSCASCIGIHELFYEPAILGAARQPGRIGRCCGRRSGVGRMGRADSDGGPELHAGGYAFLSSLHTDENPTHI